MTRKLLWNWRVINLFYLYFCKKPRKARTSYYSSPIEENKNNSERSIHLTLTINDLMNLFANKILKENVYRKNYS